MPPRLKALFLLAWALIRTVIRRVFGLGRTGLGAFAENYSADGLSAVTAEQRQQMATFGRCIACGLCDRGEGERIARSEGAYGGIMQLMLASSRSMPDFGAAARGFAHVPDEVLADKERICPARVPMRRIAAFVRDKAAEARASVRAPADAAVGRPGAAQAFEDRARSFGQTSYRTSESFGAAANAAR